MKSDELLKAIGNVDEKYIKDADQYSDKMNADKPSSSNSSDNTVSNGKIADFEDAKKQKKGSRKKNMSTFSQVYRAVLSTAAAVVLLFIFVSALNIYKKNNSTAGSTDTAFGTAATEDASDGSTTDDTAEMDGSTNSIENSLSGNAFSFDTAATEDTASTGDSSSQTSAESDTSDTNTIEHQLSSTDPNATVVTAAGSGYTFSVEVPKSFSSYNTTGADSRSVNIDYLSTDDATIILYPADNKEDYLKDGNVVYITYFADKFGVCGTGLTEENVTYGKNEGVRGTFSDTDYEYDYISFTGDNTGVVATNRSDWSSEYKTQLELVYSSLKLNK